jgi:hypothetical protein
MLHGWENEENEDVTKIQVNLTFGLLYYLKPPLNEN